MSGNRCSKRTSTTLPLTAVTLPRFKAGASLAIMRGLELRPGFYRLGAGFHTTRPLPVADFRHVLAVLIDIDLVFDELVLDHLLQISALDAQLRQAIDDVLHQVKSIQIVLHSHIKGRGDRTFFLVTANVQLPIGSPVSQPMNQLRTTVK